MTTVKPSYNAQSAKRPLVADALASGAWAMDTPFDNTDGTNGLLDEVQLGGSFMVLSGATLGANPVVTIYLAPFAYNDGTNDHYVDNATGPAGTFTPPANPNSIPIAQVAISTAGVATPFGGIHLSGFGFGRLFSKFNLWIANSTGAALAGSAGGQVSNFMYFLPGEYTAS